MGFKVVQLGVHDKLESEFILSINLYLQDSGYYCVPETDCYNMSERTVEIKTPNEENSYCHYTEKTKKVANIIVDDYECDYVYVNNMVHTALTYAWDKGFKSVAIPVAPVNDGFEEESFIYYINEYLIGISEDFIVTHPDCEVTLYKDFFSDSKVDLEDLKFRIDFMLIQDSKDTFEVKKKKVLELYKENEKYLSDLPDFSEFPQLPQKTVDMFWKLYISNRSFGMERLLYGFFRDSEEPDTDVSAASVTEASAADTSVTEASAPKTDVPKTDAPLVHGQKKTLLPENISRRKNYDSTLCLDDFIEKYKEEALSLWISKQLDQKGLKPSTLYKEAGLSKQEFSRIMRGINPMSNHKYKAILPVLAMKLPHEEFLEVISKQGVTLSDCEDRDLIIRWHILKGIYSLDEINEALYERNLELLGNVKD